MHERLLLHLNFAVKIRWWLVMVIVVIVLLLIIFVVIVIIVVVVVVILIIIIIIILILSVPFSASPPSPPSTHPHQYHHHSHRHHQHHDQIIIATITTIPSPPRLPPCLPCHSHSFHPLATRLQGHNLDPLGSYTVRISITGLFGWSARCRFEMIPPSPFACFFISLQIFFSCVSCVFFCCLLDIC